MFYILSFTWGLPMTLIGLICAAVMMLRGKKPTIYKGCIHFTSIYSLNLGIVLFTSTGSKFLKDHEYGHALQNCVYGIFSPFLVTIPSAIRFWYRQIRYIDKGKTPPTGYYDIWFEAQATRWGNARQIKEKRKKGA